MGQSLEISGRFLVGGFEVLTVATPWRVEFDDLPR